MFEWFRNKEDKEMSQIVSIYKVTIPSWIVWPGKVTLYIAYTEVACEEFIKNYPNKLLTPYMRIETQEIIIYNTD